MQPFQLPVMLLLATATLLGGWCPPDPAHAFARIPANKHVHTAPPSPSPSPPAPNPGLCGDDKVTCVELKHGGALLGKLALNRAYSVFKGIPFAEPPTKQLRWRSPVKHAGWEGRREAFHFAPNCMQSTDGGPAWETLNTSVSEDCLYLNVWKPVSFQEDLKDPLPVCLFIHGGGYAYGGANDLELDGGSFAEISDCVAVTVQYRIGVFGFLGHNNFRDPADNTTGNWGVLDQRMAMAWVHENIEAFHGDPSRIMIFGESAGAASVSNHVVRKKSFPYFANAAMQSGGFQEWATKTLANAEANFLAFEKHVGCEGKGRSCLVALPAEKIIEESTDHVYPHDDSWTACRWAPTIDHVDLSLSPEEVLKVDEAHPTASIILGTNYDEGTDFIGYNKTGTLPKYLPENLTLAGFKSWSEKIWGAKAAEVLPDLYPVPSMYPDYWEAAQHAVGDYMMTCPNARFALYHSEGRRGNNTYVYMFDELPGTVPARRGVFHGAEIRFVFFDSSFLVGWDEKGLSLDMNRFWSNLAASGDVNYRVSPNERKISVEWPKYKRTTRESVHFEAQGTSVIGNLHEQECLFWDSLE